MSDFSCIVDNPKQGAWHEKQVFWNAVRLSKSLLHATPPLQPFVYIQVCMGLQYPNQFSPDVAHDEEDATYLWDLYLDRTRNTSCFLRQVPATNTGSPTAAWSRSSAYRWEHFAHACQGSRSGICRFIKDIRCVDGMYAKAIITHTHHLC